MTLKAKLETILGEALDASLGIAVKTNDPKRLRQRLYLMQHKSRRAGLTTYAGLLFYIASPEELWIIKRAVMFEEHPALIGDP